MATDAPQSQPLNVREIYALLARRRDAALPCFTLATLACDPAAEILTVERRPTSVQIAFSLRLDGLDGEAVYATQDVPLLPLPDDEDTMGSYTVTVHGDHEDATCVEEMRLYDIPFFRGWRAWWAERPDGDEVTR